jgi:ubiquinone/menaquinone biosynthesis C-methylase UbiE
VHLKPYSGQVSLVQQTAGALPFAAHTFDAVTCLEALEFFPSDEEALAEMVRVLRPGGFLMASRRIGYEGKLFLHRYRPAAAFQALLRCLGLAQIRRHLWQEGYELVTAVKNVT